MVENKQELIGDFLKKHREQLDISIKIVANDTKINITQLEYLENNDFDKLPNIAYVRGFVKNYARTLSLDLNNCLEILESSYFPNNTQIADSTPKPVEITLKEEKKPKTKPVVKNKPKASTGQSYKKTGPNATVVGAAGFAIILVIFLVIKSGNNETEDRTPIVKEIKPQTLNLKTELLKPQDDSVATTKEVDPPETETVKALTVSKTEIKDEIKPVTQIEEKKEESIVKNKLAEVEALKVKPTIAPISLSTPKKVEEVKVLTEAKKKLSSKIELKKEISFSKVPFPLFSIDDTLSASDIADFLPTNIKNSMLTSRENIYINSAFGDTWITFKVDDNPIKKYILKKGRTLFLKGQLVRIFLGNVHVTKVFHNNKPLEIQSRSGVKSLVFPVAKAKDYVLPLFVYPKSGRVMTSETYLNSTSEKI